MKTKQTDPEHQPEPGIIGIGLAVVWVGVVMLWEMGCDFCHNLSLKYGRNDKG
jgi:hypothetical protein